MNRLVGNLLCVSVPIVMLYYCISCRQTLFRSLSGILLCFLQSPHYYEILLHLYNDQIIGFLFIWNRSFRDSFYMLQTCTFISNHPLLDEYCHGLRLHLYHCWLQCFLFRFNQISYYLNTWNYYINNFNNNHRYVSMHLYKHKLYS